MLDSPPDRGLMNNPAVSSVTPAAVFVDGSQDSEVVVLFRGISWDDYEAMLRIRGGRRFRVTFDRGLMEVVFPYRREVFPDVRWDDYEAMLRIVGDQHIRVTYDRGEMEILMPSLRHEQYSNLLGRLVEQVAQELGIDYQALGMTTWRQRGLERGLEPDQCYYIGHEAIVRQKEMIDLNIDPPPDLAIEVDITHGSLNRLGIYAQLGIPEVWRFDGASLTIHLLQKDGTHLDRESSLAFPQLKANDIVRLVEQGRTLPTSRWVKLIRELVASELAPPLHPQPGDGHEPPQL